MKQPEVVSDVKSRANNWKTWMFSVRVILSALLRSTKITGGKWLLKQKRLTITWTLNSRLSQSSITLMWARGWSSRFGTMIQRPSTSWLDWRIAPSMNYFKLKLADNHGHPDSHILTSPMTKSVAQLSSTSPESNEITSYKSKGIFTQELQIQNKFRKRRNYRLQKRL